MQKNTQNIKYFFRCAGATRKHNDTVTGAHKGFQAFFYIWENDQLVDNWIRRFSGNNARFSHTYITAVINTLFVVSYGGALHWAFHGAGTTAGADIQPAQPQLMADFFGVVIFFTADGVSAPTYSQVGLFLWFQNIGIA